ncbi:hypothetical protein M1146_05335 [Patescibacteria group bacterium]|nr:hypothetical protein [Patescibacteria group bacterium]
MGENGDQIDSSLTLFLSEDIKVVPVAEQVLTSDDSFSITQFNILAGNLGNILFPRFSSNFHVCLPFYHLRVPSLTFISRTKVFPLCRTAQIRMVSCFLRSFLPFSITSSLVFCGGRPSDLLFQAEKEVFDSRECAST